MLDQILADPADDALRLVYADQLLSAGDERGEYIAVELQLAAAARGSSEHAELARRRAELRVAHGARWWPELPERRIGTRGGFADTVAMFPAELDLLPELARREPIDALELLDHRGIAPLPAAPWQERIRRLVVHGTPRGEELRALWQGPLGDVVEEVAVASSSTSRWLPSGGQLPRCRGLYLAGSSFEEVVLDDPLRALSHWRHLARLEVLDLAYCPGIGAAAVRTLASFDLRALRVLRLSGNPIGDDGARLLAEHLRSFPALERLELLDARIGPAGAAVLRAAETRAEIALEAPPASRLAIDNLGIQVELIQVGATEWALAIDGTPRPIALRVDDAQRALDSAPLGPVVRALQAGAPRKLMSNGVVVPISHARMAVLVIPPDRSGIWYEPP